MINCVNITCRFFFGKGGGGGIYKKGHVQYIWANVVHASVTHVDNAILHCVPSHTWTQVERQGIIKEKKKNNQHDHSSTRNNSDY